MATLVRGGWVAGTEDVAETEQREPVASRLSVCALHGQEHPRARVGGVGGRRVLGHLGQVVCGGP